MKKKSREINRRAASDLGVSVPSELASDQCVTPDEAARILAVCSEQVTRFIYQRRLPAVKIANGYWKIRKVDLERFIELRLKVPAPKVLVFPTTAKTKLISKAVRRGQRAALTAFSVSDALLKAQSLQPVAIVLDLSSRDAAWSFIRKIRQLKFKRLIPIILISQAQLKKSELTEALRLGVQGLVTGSPSEDRMLFEIESHVRQFC